MFRSTVAFLLVCAAFSANALSAQTTCTPDSSCLNPPPLPASPFAGYPVIQSVPPPADPCNLTWADSVIVKYAGDINVQSFVSDALNTWMNYIFVPDPAATCRDTRINRFTWYNRDASRAAVFLSLLTSLQQSPATLTAEQAAVITVMTRELQVRLQDAALDASYEYNRWVANPCTYTAPPGFAMYNAGASNCFQADAGPQPIANANPPLPPFAAYGAGAAFALLNSTPGANAARETVSLLAPALEQLYRGTGFGSYTTLSPYALSMEGALAPMGSSHAFGIHPLGQMLAPSAVVSAALANSFLNQVANANAAQLPAALNQAVAASNNSLQLQSLLFTQGGQVNIVTLQELLGTFLELTLLDGPDPQLFVPATSAGAPSLEVISSTGATTNPSVQVTIGNSVYKQFSTATVSLNKNWFAISTDGVTARLSYLLGYLTWDGNVEQARIMSGMFFTADAGNSAAHVSPFLYMRDANLNTLRVQLAGASLPAPTGASQSFVMSPPSGSVYNDSIFMFPDWSGKLSTIQYDGTSMVMTPFFGNAQIKTTQFQYIAWDGSFWTATINPVTKLFFLSRRNSLTGMIANNVKLRGFDGGNWTFQLK